MRWLTLRRCDFVGLLLSGKEKRNFKTGLLEKKPDYKKAYVTLLHPFKYPTLDEQRNMRTVMPDEDA